MQCLPQRSKIQPGVLKKNRRQSTKRASEWPCRACTHAQASTTRDAGFHAQARHKQPVQPRCSLGAYALQQDDPVCAQRAAGESSSPAEPSTQPSKRQHSPHHTLQGAGRASSIPPPGPAERSADPECGNTAPASCQSPPCVHVAATPRQARVQGPGLAGAQHMGRRAWWPPARREHVPGLDPGVRASPGSTHGGGRGGLAARVWARLARARALGRRSRRLQPLLRPRQG